MKLNNDKWIALYKRVVEQTKLQPSSGDVCAVASILFMRDTVIDDIFGSAEQIAKFDRGQMSEVETMKECFDELVTQILTGGDACPELKGFASNASAAAKAAGFKAVERTAALAGLKDLLG